MRSVLHALLVAATVVWLCVGVFAWILRDGLGPEAAESANIEAVKRFFWAWYGGPVMLALCGSQLLLSRQAAKTRVVNQPS